MVVDRRGPIFSRRVVLVSLLVCSFLIAGLIAWNLSSAPTMRPVERRGQASTDYNLVFDSSSSGSPSPTPTGPGSRQNLLPVGSSGTSYVATPSESAGSKMVIAGTPTPASYQSYPVDLLAGTLPTPTPATSQTRLGTQANSGSNNTISKMDVNGPPVGKVTARGAELIDANGVRFFVAGINYEGHTDRAWLMWQNDKFDPALIGQNFALAAAGGYNSIRIFIQTQARDDVKANNWTKFDKVAELAQQNGLRLLITLADYYEPDLSKLVEVDTSIAHHFANSSVILGYDFRNEPQYSDLISAIYPAGQQPPLQTEDMIKVYGERVNQSDSDGWRNGAGRTQVPDHLNSRQAYVYANMLRYYDEFQTDTGNWVNRNARSTPLDFFNSPDSAKWKPFIDALNGTVQKYIEVRQRAVQIADPGRLTTIGWNRPTLVRMPANRALGFISFHNFPGDSAGGLAGTLAVLDGLKNFYGGQPVVMEEFGYSNSDGKNDIPLLRTASYEAAIWLFLYGRGYAGGFKWMLNNFNIGANPYENNFGLFDNNNQPKPAYFSAQAILRLAAANRAPSGDFSRLESYDGVQISYSWGSSNAFFGNGKAYQDDRVQLVQQDAAPWGVWWPNNGQGQVYISLTTPGQVQVNLRSIFPSWRSGMRPILNTESGATVNFEQRGDALVAFSVQPGTVYTIKAPIRPAAFNQATPLNVVSNTYFKETGHNLSNVFKRYWETKGGLAIYGFPISEEFQENGYTVQYFERARFEFHPEHSGTPNEVQLGLLGNVITAGRKDAGEPPFQPIAPFNSAGTDFYYKETGHSLRGGFKAFWDAKGGLAQFGFPITEEFFEVNPADGKTYTVQYFERNRFEWHPEFGGTPSEFQLGLLGLQVVRARGWVS